jgi:hypothetical protein
MVNRWVETLDEAWRSWLTALDRVDPARRDERVVCGHWSVKDLVGHIALWDAETLTDIQRWHLDLEPIRNDWQRINDDDHARKLHTPYDLLRIEMHLVHQTLRDAVAQLPDDLPAGIVEQIADDAWEHYDLHRSDIETWLKKT